MNAVRFGGTGNNGKKPYKKNNKDKKSDPTPETKSQHKEKKEHRTNSIYQQILTLLRTPDKNGDRQLTLKEVDDFAYFLQHSAKNTLNKAAGEEYDANMKAMLQNNKKDDTNGDQVEGGEDNSESHRPSGRHE